MPRALEMLSFLPALRSFTADDISSCVNAVRTLADYPSVVRVSLPSAQLDAARVRYLLERKPGLQSLHAVNIALVRQWAVSPIWSLGIGMHEVDVDAALSLVGREVRELSEMALPDQYGKLAALKQECVARHCPNLRTLKLLHHLKVEPPVLDALPATLEGCPKLDSLELISALPLHIARLYRVRDAGPYISFFLSSSSLVNLSIVESHSIPSHWAAEPSDLLYVLAAYAPTNQPQRSITLDPPLRRWHRRESVRWREEDAAPVIALAKEKGIELTITSL